MAAEYGSLCVSDTVFRKRSTPVDHKQVCRFFSCIFKRDFYILWHGLSRTNERKTDRYRNGSRNDHNIIMWQNEPLTDLVGNVNPLNGQSHMSHCSANTSRISLLAMCATKYKKSEQNYIYYQRHFFPCMPAFNEKRKTIEIFAVDCVRFDVRANMLESNCRCPFVVSSVLFSFLTSSISIVLF